MAEEEKAPGGDEEAGEAAAEEGEDGVRALPHIRPLPAPRPPVPPKRPSTTQPLRPCAVPLLHHAAPPYTTAVSSDYPST